MAAPRRRTVVLVLSALVAALAAGPPGASARRASRVPSLKWPACPKAAGFPFASASVPKDYAVPGQGKIALAPPRLPAPHLWSTDSPYLYRATLNLGDARGRHLESYFTYSGVRSIKVVGGRVLLNGRALDVRGVNIHEQNIMTGAALSPGQLQALVGWTRELGGTIIRAHYPLNPEKMFVKRVIAKEGDTVRIVDGHVYVNDIPLRDDYVPVEFRSHDDWGPQVIQQGYYFVMGDHRNNSYDSSKWVTPWLARRYIVGKAWIAYWPFHDLHVFSGIPRLPLAWLGL